MWGVGGNVGVGEGQGWRLGLGWGQWVFTDAALLLGSADFRIWGRWTMISSACVCGNLWLCILLTQPPRFAESALHAF